MDPTIKSTSSFPLRRSKSCSCLDTTLPCSTEENTNPLRSGMPWALGAVKKHLPRSRSPECNLQSLPVLISGLAEIACLFGPYRENIYNRAMLNLHIGEGFHLRHNAGEPHDLI